MSSIAPSNNTHPAPPSKFDAAVLDWINVAKTVSAFDKIDVLSACADGMASKENIYAPHTNAANANGNDAASPGGSPSAAAGTAATHRRPVPKATAKSSSVPSPTDQTQLRREAFVNTKKSIDEKIVALELEAQENYEREMGAKERLSAAPPTVSSSPLEEEAEGEGDDAICADIDEETEELPEEARADESNASPTSSSSPAADHEEGEEEQKKEKIPSSSSSVAAAEDAVSGDAEGRGDESIAAEAMADVVCDENDDEKKFSGTPPQERAE